MFRSFSIRKSRRLFNYSRMNLTCYRPFGLSTFNLLMTVLCCLIVSCSKGHPEADNQQVATDATMTTSTSSPAPPAPAPEARQSMEKGPDMMPPEQPPMVTTPPRDRPKLIVKNGELSVDVSNYELAQQEIQSITTRHAGVITGNNTHMSPDNAVSGFITVKIPVANFEAALREFRKVGDRLVSENVNATDVSAHYYDLEARINNKRRTEERLVEILTKANRVEDILNIERELSMVREQIEQMEAQRKGMADQAAMSTLTIRLNGDEEPNFFSKIGDAFETGVNGFTSALAGVITFLIAGLPIFAVLLLLGWVVYRLILRARQNSRPRSPEEPIVIKH